MNRSNSVRMLSIVLAAALICAASLSAVRAADKKPFTPGDIWKLKGVGEPQLSPDGKWIAYTLTTTDTRRLQTLAARNSAATLRWRVIATDADKTFTGRSESAATAVP